MKIVLNSYGALAAYFVLFLHRKSSEKALGKIGSLTSENSPKCIWEGSLLPKCRAMKAPLMANRWVYMH